MGHHDEVSPSASTSQTALLDKTDEKTSLNDSSHDSSLINGIETSLLARTYPLFRLSSELHTVSEDSRRNQSPVPRSLVDRIAPPSSSLLERVGPPLVRRRTTSPKLSLEERLSNPGKRRAYHYTSLDSGVQGDEGDGTDVIQVNMRSNSVRARFCMSLS